MEVLVSPPRPSRRELLRIGIGALGLPTYLGLRSAPAAYSETRARSVSVLYCGRGMSHLDTWDLRPDAPAAYRDEFLPTTTPIPTPPLADHHQPPPPHA